MCSDWLKAVFRSGLPNAEVKTAFVGVFWEHGQMLFYKTITLWFPCLDGLIQALEKFVWVKKSVQNMSRRQVIYRTFLNLSNFPACLDQAIQTRKP